MNIAVIPRQKSLAPSDNPLLDPERFCTERAPRRRRMERTMLEHCAQLDIEGVDVCVSGINVLDHFKDHRLVYGHKYPFHVCEINPKCMERMRWLMDEYVNGGLTLTKDVTREKAREYEQIVRAYDNGNCLHHGSVFDFIETLQEKTALLDLDLTGTLQNLYPRVIKCVSHMLKNDKFDEKACMTFTHARRDSHWYMENPNIDGHVYNYKWRELKNLLRKNIRRLLKDNGYSLITTRCFEYAEKAPKYSNARSGMAMAYHIWYLQKVA